MNKVMLLGRLTKEPEIRFSQLNSTMIVNFTLAVNRKYVKQGEERQTDFINILTFSKLADFAQKYLKKGLQICISGRIQTRSWEDNDGHNHYTTEIVAEEIYFADSLKKSDERVLFDNSLVNSNNGMNQDEEIISSGDDLPF